MVKDHSDSEKGERDREREREREREMFYLTTQSTQLLFTVIWHQNDSEKG